MKHASEEIHPDFETQGRRHQKSKREVAPHKYLMSSVFEKNNVPSVFVFIAGVGPSSERQPAVPRLLPLPQQRQGLGAQRDREAGIPDPRIQVLLP